ncbi:MAG: thiamine pyrophosphate-binding protein, partial [Dehalococcoidia bacterium]|nr:thiamine pyrophosphate-binding protein [Dehalococcoidia bacterium]
ITFMRGSHVLMECLLAEGVEYVFGNPGSTESGILDSFQDYSQIEYVLGLHEAVAVAMSSLK